MNRGCLLANDISQEALDWPRLATVGIDGLLVSFGDALREPANRAALAFRAALDRAAIDGIEETATSLVSTYVRFDPLHVDHAGLSRQLETLLERRDWYDEPLPEGRRFFEIPTVYDATFAPQLPEAAAAAGMDVPEAVAMLSAARVRVQTIGFAPGMPYFGTLPEAWDIPRLQDLTPKVPASALVLAIRQFVLFPVETPTGWRHVGQTAAPLFRPQSDDPFLLRPGDEARFVSVSPETFTAMRDRDPMSGVRMEVIR